MLGIIIGIILIVIGILLCRDILLGGGGAIVVMIGVIWLTLAIVAPLSGYEEASELIEEVKLEAIYTNEAKQEIYAIKTNLGYTISYKETVDNYGIEQEVTRTEVINCEVIEDENCNIPTKKTYLNKGKRSIWTLALFADFKEHVLIVPVGSIRK